MTTPDLDKVLAVQEERASADLSWVFDSIPLQVMPPNWHVAQKTEDGAKYVKLRTRRRLPGVKSPKRRTVATIIVSGSTEDDGKRWLHLSMSYVGRVPTWQELVDAKEWIFGTKTKAIQVIPARSEYVNIHPHVLHLFVCVDEDPLPDFTAGTGSL